jgi:hypothetical protein
MKTTICIDNDLVVELRRLAAAGRVSLSQALNQVIRRGLAEAPSRHPTHRQVVHSMGVPRVDLDKALAVAAAEEDAETLRKLESRGDGVLTRLKRISIDGPSDLAASLDDRSR